MSTQLGLNRKFERNSEGEVIRRRDEKGNLAPLPPFTQKVGECPVCGLAVMGAPGQAVRAGAHKACRKKAGIKKTDTAAIAIRKATFEREQQQRHEQARAKVA